MLWLLLACAKDAPVVDSVPALPADLTAPPWVLITGPNSALLRFETLDQDTELPVEITLGAADPVTHIPVRSSLQTPYAFPPVPPNPDLLFQDLPGVRVLHELELTELVPGEPIGWRLELGAGEFLDGSFRIPAPDQDFVAVFTGDTMFPKLDEVVEQAAPFAPDLYIHGGDLQYQSNPFDTWTGLMHSIAPLTAQAPFHPAVGNHEYEGQDEFAVMFERFFEGAGDAEQGTAYHAFSAGGVRFIALNSESEHGLADAESPQVRWLTLELIEHADEPVVVYFHRPIITLAKHEPRLDLREVVHPLCAGHGVDLVLTAHNHSYERFEMDQVPYVVDGGGGAFLYSVTEHEADYPEDLERRQAYDKSMGFTVLRFSDQGIDLERYDIDGEQVDAALLPYRELPD
jgi:hypothetical protein